MKYNKSEIFKKAWRFVKTLRANIGTALKRAWAEAKAFKAGSRKEEKKMVKVVVNDDRTELYTPYSKDFVAEIKSIGGAKWNPNKSCWTIPTEALDTAKKIMLRVFGEDGETKQPTLTIRLTLEEDQYSEKSSAYTLLGKTIAKATSGRDSRVWLGEDVIFEEGKPTSTGSRNSWWTKVPSGSIIKLNNVSLTLWEEFKNDKHEGIKAEVVEDKIDREALKNEKEKLLKRLAEIKLLLGEN